MRHVLYMAWRYVAFHRLKSSILVGAIALIVFIPAALRVLVRQGETQLTARAEATPLLLGTRDSPLELVLNSLYFSSDVPETLAFGRVNDVAGTGLAEAIPLYVRFRSQDDPIVGTTLDYFAARGLRVAAGRQMTTLGECVVGAAVAAARGLKPGDHVTSSPESVFDLAGVYPLKTRVTGVLAPSGGPDDDAIFVDVKTAWIMEGLAHGHEDLSQPGAAGRVLRREGNTIVGNASVREYQEITRDNIDSFHFHGDVAEFPITAVIVLPADQKSRALLLGRYQSHETLQLLPPPAVVDELLATVFSVQSVIVAALFVVGATTAALVALVFLLSLRLRRGEIETMMKIGGSRRRIASILGLEMVGVLGLGLLLSAGLTWGTSQIGPTAIRYLLSQ